MATETDSLIYFAEKGDAAAVKKILEREPLALNQVGRDGTTALTAAVRKRRLEVVEALLARGVDVDACASNGQTALHIAVIANHPSMVALLVKAGANVNAKDEFGRIALHYSAMLGKKETAELLIQAASDLHAADNDGYTPMAQALVEAEEHLVPLFRNAGARETALDVLRFKSRGRAIRMLKRLR